LLYSGFCLVTDGVQSFGVVDVVSEVLVVILVCLVCNSVLPLAQTGCLEGFDFSTWLSKSTPFFFRRAFLVGHCSLCTGSTCPGGVQSRGRGLDNCSLAPS
jgi:hypothetical protein